MPTYTPEQQRAIDTIGNNLQIIACAGSGKTAVVSARIVNILKSKPGLKPDNIVAFTFTEKAAAELKDRITKLYKDAFGNVEGLAGMYVGTIHGFCLDLLQRYLYQYLKYDVLDEVQQRLFVDRNFRKSGMADLGLRRWIESDIYLTALRILREADADPKLLETHQARASLQAYQDLLDEHGYFDFDEILLRAVVELSVNDELRTAIKERIKFLIVDEYQDVNPIQEQLIRTIHELGANLCVVGDDDQNIYQWRGSDVNHIVDFADRYDDVTPIPLETNFRSSPAVINVARRIVEQNTNRLEKEMKSAGTQDFDRGDLLALSFDDPITEANWIAEKIAAMHGTAYKDKHGERGLAWSDFAILLRSVRRCAGPIVDALKARGIPVVVTGMAGLMETTEAVAASTIFRYVTKEIEPQALKDAWHAAALGLSDADLDRGIALLDERRNFDPGFRFATYNLQRTYLDFLEAIQLRETKVPGARGEVAYYNLGKFSQVISDYEEIHYKSKPEEKYRSFVAFLQYQAAKYYPEGGQDAGYAVPTAVRIMTVHQAKGMEFPAVFIPSLQRNRFPAKKQHNRVWTYIPRDAIKNAARYDTSEPDERRLMYVALTRSEKYLYCSWARDEDNQLYRKPSIFFEELSRMSEFLTRDPTPSGAAKLPSVARAPMINVELTFSELKYYFECPYQFKLRFLYGFNPPLHEALGYGRSLHNILAEIHRRALAGEKMTKDDVPDLVDTHLHVRYAYDTLEESLAKSAKKAIELYLRENGPNLDRLEHVEETIQLSLRDGIVVHGRIDLIRRTDTHETTIVDFKSVERAQAEDITRLQLHTYAFGYEERFGKRADLIEVHNLDEGGSVREVVDKALIAETVDKIVDAGNALRANSLPMLKTWCKTCSTCDVKGICRTSAST